MKFVWNGKNKVFSFLFLAGILLVCTPGCDDSPTRPGEGFYEYTGYRDWWRIPLCFPYQITITEDFKDGLLEKFDPNTRIGDPNSNTAVVQDKITKIGFHDNFAVFKQKNEGNPYGLLVYASGDLSFFSKEEKLKAFIRQKYPDALVPEMMGLKKFYDLRWKTIHKLQKETPGKLYYPESDLAPKRPNECFYSYKGYRDWWRIPWRYPYQIKITDSFEDGGRLEKYNPKTLIVDPQHEMVRDIMKVGFCRNHIIFKQKNGSEPYGTLSVLGWMKKFRNEEDLAKYVKQTYPRDPVPKLVNLEELYELYWKAPENIRKLSPEILTLGN